MVKIYKIICLLFFFGLLPFGANAATLSFSPSSGSYAVGNTFSASILISSADQAMNAALGAISFPPDKLEVVSVSKTGSVFTLWVQEPTFSNSAGAVTFEGIVLNPGFMGANRKAVTINFKVKAADKSGNERVTAIPAQKPRAWYKNYWIIGIIVLVVIAIARRRL